MTVPMKEMERFIKAVTYEHADCICYSTEGITPVLFGKKVIIVGGALDGTIGHLLTKIGSKKKTIDVAT